MKKLNTQTKQFEDYVDDDVVERLCEKLKENNVPYTRTGNNLFIDDKDLANAQSEANKL